MENNDLIWYKSVFEPGMSFSNSLWIAIHSQILNYVNIDNYIIRINKINNIINFKKDFGFIYNERNLNRLSTYLNYSMKKMDIRDFKIKIKEDNDMLKAINYMRNNRFLIIGIPYYYIKKYTNYNMINIQEKIIQYFAAFSFNDYIILIPDMDIEEEKLDISTFCSKYMDIIKINYEKFVELYKNIDDEYKRIVYVNVFNKNGIEIKSLTEF